jgi:AraC-like DNA-binding protein
MPIGVAPLLNRHRQFHSTDTEETRAFLGRKSYRFDVPNREARQLDACVNAFYMPGMYLAYTHYGRLPVELSPGRQRSDYVIQLPLRGRLEATIGTDRVVCDARQAAIASPTREQCLFRSEADNARMQFVLSQTVLIDQLTALLGEPPANVPDFAPAIDLTSGHGRSLAQYLLMAAVDLDRADSMLAHPTTMGMFQQFIITGLLLSQPHSHFDSLLRLSGPIAPHGVKRAIDYMEANLAQPIVLADIVAAAGIPGRTLLQHFRDSSGTSPMRYVRDMRMARVRQDLLRAHDGESVTEIALRWGFNHLGRFAAEYRRRFGETPSETRRRGR